MNSENNSLKDRKALKIIKKILPHLIFILAAALIVLLIVDYYNPMMNFLDNTPAHCIMWALCILSIIHFIILLI